MAKEYEPRESKEIPGARDYHLGDILSVSTGYLVSPRHMDGVYDILNFMTGDDLYTHQLPRAMEECKPYLIDEMIWLKDIVAGSVNSNNYKEWLKDQVDKYGEYHPVRPIHHEDHLIIDPFDEPKRMGVDESRIVKFDVNDKKSPNNGDGKFSLN